MKVDEYSFKNVSQEVVDFKDQVTLILNNGKYSNQIVGTPPTWTGRNGEAVFMDSSGIQRWYYYLNANWKFVQFNTQTVKGFIYFSGTGSLSIDDHFNVQSLTRNAAGIYTVAWINSMSNAFYSVGANPKMNIGVDRYGFFNLSSLTVNSCNIAIRDVSGTNYDPDFATLIICGNQ